MPQRDVGIAPEQRSDVGVIVKDSPSAPKAARELFISRHLLDLKPLAPKKPVVQPKQPTSPSRTPSWQLLLDQRIHLREMRNPSLSHKPNAWDDFPPNSAKNLTHAVALTVGRFFREHPLADLTVLTVAHMAVMVIWKFMTLPASLLKRTEKKREPAKAHATKNQILPVLPFALVAAPAVKEKQVIKPAAKTQAEPQPISASPRLRISASSARPFWQRVNAIGLAAAALLFTLPFGAFSALNAVRDSKAEVMNRGAEAIGRLKAAKEAAQSNDFVGANRAFTDAADMFASARERLGLAGNLLSSVASIILPIRGPIGAASPALTAGTELAVSGSILTLGVSEAERSASPLAAVETLRGRLAEALPHLSRAEHSLAEIPLSAAPEEYREQLADAQGLIPALKAYLDKAAEISGFLPAIMGANGVMRYLVIFQNDAEIRPTGGFMGSFALIDVSDGRVIGVEIPQGGTYDLKGSQSLKLESPQPLHLVNARWEFQDANWSPDFPTSAKNIVRFYEEAGGPTVDGVIALNTPVIEKLLEIIGPVDMPEYGKIIDSRNFYFETQKAVELDYDRTENRPKKFLADLAPKIMTKAMATDPSLFQRLAGMVDGALTEKQALLWFRDAQVQSSMVRLGWDGGIKTADGDYLAVIHANIAGQKTDRVITEKISHEVKVLADGTGIVTLEIERKHNGTAGALFSGVRNVDYLRVFVPAGSELIDAKGFSPPDPKLFKIADPLFGRDPDLAAQEDSERVDPASGTRITTESGKTVFGNWTQTDPGQTTTVTLVYRLPVGLIGVHRPSTDPLASLVNRVVKDTERLDYRLLVQKQPGADRTTFISSLDLPRGYLLSDPQGREEDDRGRWTISLPLEHDVSLDASPEMP